MIKRKIYLLAVVTVALIQAFAQPLKAENLILQSNKNTFVSGEKIGFNCTLQSNELTTQKILFVDVCGENYMISSQILKPQYKNWAGSIVLPDTLQTGVYLLRAYCGNKNGIPTLISKPIAVFNRFGNNEVNEKRKLTSKNVPYFPPLNESAVDDEILSTYASKTTYSTNDEIKFWIENNSSNLNEDLSFLVRKAEVDSVFENTTEKHFLSFITDSCIRINNNLYLNGIVKEGETMIPVVNKKVLLSIPDTIPSINYARTNENGEFRFLLNEYYGLQDLVLQTINKNVEFDLQVYPILLLPPNSIPYYISSAFENSEFVKLAINRATLHKAYGSLEEAHKNTRGFKIPFYGEPSIKTFPELYVALQDFEEIAWEILPIVKYRKEKNGVSIKLWDPISKVFYDNPWILVDGIPVFEALSLNVLSSNDIKSIEIQPQVRCFGALFIEGVLSIRTKNEDFSDVEMPKNAVRLTVNTYYNKLIDKEADQPLFRDILYWNPSLKSKQQMNQVSVKTSFEKGIYVAIAQLVDEKGKVHRSEFKFVVE